MNAPVKNALPVPFGFTFVAPLALGSVLNPINSTMLTTALVPIADSLKTSIAETGWLIAGLYMTSAVAQPTMGKLVDLFGPRRIYLICLCLVALAGIWGQLASSVFGLVLVRVLLGIGTSGAYPAAMRLFREKADKLGAKPPRVAMGVMSLSAVATMAIGPLLGGLLTGWLGWHAIFAVNLPLALITIVLVLLWIPKDAPRRASCSVLMKDLDMPGIGLFAAFLLCFMTFLMNLNKPLWLALGGAGVFGFLLLLESLRRKQPFINLRMLAHNKPLLVTYLRVFVVTTVSYCILYGFAQWLESSVGLSSSLAGVITLPLSVVAAVSSVTGVRTKGLRAPFLISIGAAVVGCCCLFFVNSTTSLLFLALAVAFFGIPQGSFSTATQTAIYLQTPPQEIGAASGLQRTSAYMGAVVAASLLALLYGHRATDSGLHELALVLGLATILLFVLTLFDRTIPQENKL